MQNNSGANNFYFDNETNAEYLAIIEQYVPDLFLGLYRAEKIDPEAPFWLAWRMALRLFPMLMQDKAFEIWAQREKLSNQKYETRVRHILATFEVCLSLNKFTIATNTAFETDFTNSVIDHQSNPLTSHQKVVLGMLGVMILMDEPYRTTLIENFSQAFVEDIELIKRGAHRYTTIDQLTSTAVWFENADVPEVIRNKLVPHFVSILKELSAELSAENGKIKVQKALFGILKSYTDLLGVSFEQFISNEPDIIAEAQPELVAETQRENPQDKLNREPLVNALAAYLQHPENKHHVTLGLLGHWGAGKTRVLDLLKSTLLTNRGHDEKKNWHSFLLAFKGHYPKAISAQLFVLLTFLGLDVLALLFSCIYFSVPLPAVLLWGFESMAGRISLGFVGFAYLFVMYELFRCSSISNYENKSNRESAPYIYGEFNAWAYEHSDNIQAGVAHEAIAALTSRPDKHNRATWAGYRIWLACRFAGRLHGKQLFLLVAIVFLSAMAIDNYLWLPIDGENSNLTKSGVIIGTSIGALFLVIQQTHKVFNQSFAKELYTYLKLPDYQKEIGLVAVMRQQISELCQIRLGTPDAERQRLLFVVDDLDRCSPEGIVKTFEAVRLVMDIPLVTVVIAIDQRIALAALAQRYNELTEHHELQDAKAIARDYLGKMLHIPIVLAEPDSNTVSGFLAHIWGDSTQAHSQWQSPKSSGVYEENDSLEEAVEDGNSIAKGADEKAGGSAETEDQPSSETPEKTEPKDDELDMDKLVSDILENVPDVDVQELFEPKPLVVEGFSNEEKTLFDEWVAIFGFNNPRQLKRLHNSYNLLRLMNQQGQTFAFSEPVLMLGLFAQEFINNEDHIEHRKRLTVFFLNGPEPQDPSMKNKHSNQPEILSQALFAARNELAEYEVDGQEKLKQLLTTVEPYVLPAVQQNTDQAEATTKNHNG